MNNILDPETKKTLIKNLKEKKKYILDKTTSIDLETIFPMGGGECYFCILNDICEKCEYKEKHKKCDEYESSWYIIQHNFDEIEEYVYNRRQVSSIYKKYINFINKSKTVDEVMTLKKNLMIELAMSIKPKIPENDESIEIIDNFIKAVDENYWLESPIKINFKFYVSDLKEDLSNRLVENGFKRTDVIFETMLNIDDVKLPQKIEIVKNDGEKLYYVLTIVANNSVALISPDFKTRWSDSKNLNIEIKDGKPYIKYDDFIKLIGDEHNYKFRFID